MAFATMGLEAACARGFLAGKTVLLTGPTAGLGAAMVDELCMLGPNKPKKVRAGPTKIASAVVRAGAASPLSRGCIGGEHAEFQTHATLSVPLRGGSTLGMDDGWPRALYPSVEYTLASRQQSINHYSDRRSSNPAERAVETLACPGVFRFLLTGDDIPHTRHTTS